MFHEGRGCTLRRLVEQFSRRPDITQESSSTEFRAARSDDLKAPQELARQYLRDPLGVFLPHAAEHFPENDLGVGPLAEFVERPVPDQPQEEFEEAAIGVEIRTPHYGPESRGPLAIPLLVRFEEPSDRARRMALMKRHVSDRILHQQIAVRGQPFRDQATSRDEFEPRP